MKAKLSFALLFISTFVVAQGVWTQKANVGGAVRNGAVAFTIGTKIYVGTASVAGNDFWEWDQATNIWTQKANVGGNARQFASGFSIGSKGYIGIGGIPPTYFSDFWEYDPSVNIWLQKANFPGGARRKASAFAIGSKGYICCGGNVSTSPTFQDVWEYNPATDVWTQKNNFPGGIRYEAASFGTTIKGYVSGGEGTSVVFQDLWEYDPSNDTWQQKTNFPGYKRYSAAGASDGTNGYICTGGSFYSDFWRYRPSTNSWDTATAIPQFISSQRKEAIACCIGTKLYFGTGLNPSFQGTNDFWEFTPCVIPTPTITQNADTFVCSGGYLTYQWFNGSLNNPLLNATTQKYVPVSNNLYFVKVTNATCATTVSKNFNPGVTPITYEKTIYHSWNNGPAIESKNISATSDGGFIMTGFGACYWNVWDIPLIKTDGNGEVQWTKYFHSTSNSTSTGFSVFQTEDSGYILAGVLGQDGLSLIKTDSVGNRQWVVHNSNYTIRGSDALVQNKDGSYAVLGNNQVNGHDRMYVIKVNSGGAVQWEKGYGNTSLNGQLPTSIVATSDKGYFITGQYSGGPLLMKLDSMGNISWTKIFSYTAFSCTSIQTSDGNYLMANVAGGFLNIIKMNPLGNIIWTRADSISGFVQHYQLKESKTGGYLISGESASTGWPKPVIIKIDFNGDLIWTKSFQYGVPSSTNYNFIGFAETPDRGIAMLSKTDWNNGVIEQLYLLKLNMRGVGCQLSGVAAKQSNCVWPLNTVPYSIYQLATIGAAGLTTSVVDTTLLLTTYSICVTCAPPTANFTYWASGLNVQFFDSLSYGTSYQWTFGDNSSSVFVNPSHSYSVAGTYNVCMKAKNNCGLDSVCKNIVVPLYSNVTESQAGIQVNIYPNPANGIFTLDVEKQITGLKQILIYNVMGEKIYQSEVLNQKSLIDISSQPNGIYFLQIKTAEGVVVRKIMKE